ncbi:tonsoku-like protein, partial [Asbolus verrucosus]
LLKRRSKALKDNNEGIILEYAIVNRGIGEVHLGLCKFDKALHHQKMYLEKIRSKPVLLGTILLSKSEVLVKLEDFHAAKSTLLKAYKLKIPNKKERDTIEKNLRVVASMCKYEDKLLTTEDTNYKDLKIYYEKMGDGACELKCYGKALDYYKKMLDSAKKAGIAASDLASCYYSLAETYKDNGQFEEAVNYFEMELKLCQALKDNLNTLSHIADIKEAANCPVSEVQAVYTRAIESCQKEGDTHEEGRMLKRFITYLRRQGKHSEAFQFEQTLTKLNYNSSDSEGESSEAYAGSVIGGDINLDEITDTSDDSDTEQSVQNKPRRRCKNFSVKRNAKGETPLHTACINKNVNGVRLLLEQGHPVNVRDNCGWLPLHEACNRGYVDIVEILIEKGAAINDRGGIGCEGITPMHDAASNGHLEVVQLLLNKGANAVAKTDDGNTVLQFIKRWRSDVQLNSEAEALYESIVVQITQALDKAGHGNQDQAMKIASLSQANGRENLVKSTNRSELRRSTNMNELRRSTTVGLEDDISSDSHDDIVEDYRNAMRNIRHRNDKKTSKKTSGVVKRSALMAGDEVIDDWLEDDMGKIFKKRKINSPSKSERPQTPASKSTPRKSALHQSDNDIMVVDDSPRNFEVLVDSEPENNYYDPYNTPSTSKGFFDDKTKSSPSPPKSNLSVNKKRKQTKLTSFGHTRTLVEADSTSSPSFSKKNSFDSTTKRSPKTYSLDNVQSQPVMDPTLSVDVRINEKLYRVPVLLSQVNTHTIKWLADEAASRYAR